MLPAPLKNPRAPAFSLSELMVALGIVAALAAVAVPVSTEWLPRQRLQRAAREMYANLQWTRMGAIKNNRPWAVVFDTAGRRYSICSDPGADGSWSTLGDNTLEKQATLDEYGDRIAFAHGSATVPVEGAFEDHVTFPGNVAVFSPRGTASGGVVYLADTGSGESFGSQVRSTGMVALRKWNGSGWK